MPISLKFSQLVVLLESIFVRHGARKEVARILAVNCAMCERDGSHSHGIFRMKGYVESMRSGWVDGKASPVLEDVALAFCRVDARNGFSQPALALGAETVTQKARRAGVAVLSIRNSHHFSALWPDVEPFAEQGLVALSLVNSFACTIPFSGNRAVFGTNPMAFAAPREGGDLVVFDMATSAMANGDVQIAAQDGKLLPPNVGVDRSGEPTTDPTAVLNGGSLLTFGGHKGSSISLMIELLGAALSGGHFSFEFDWSDHEGAQTPHTGQFLLLIDPSKAGGRAFASRAADLIERIRGSGVDRLPGERRFAERRLAETRGISISAANFAELEELRAGPITN